MMEMLKFVQTASIDPIQGIVTGIACAEELDRDGEVLDYEASKPFFQQWSASQKVASGGKSEGNVRLQHDPKRPVGRLLDLQFDDAKKQVRVIAKIEETEARNLLASGVLTGFSIGGSYVSKTPVNGKVRYVANPSEISVVDRPCTPSAVFESIKADGSRELRKFVTVLDHDGLASEIQKMLAAGMSDQQVMVKYSITPGRLYQLKKSEIKSELNRANMQQRRRDVIESAFGVKFFNGR